MDTRCTRPKTNWLAFEKVNRKIPMADHFSSLTDQDLIAYSDDVVGKFQHSCRLANEDDRVRSQMLSLLKSADVGESFDRLCDDDHQLAEQLLRLGLLAMISSRMILLAQKELMKRGVIPTPTDF
jgi:hypothetical protein